MDTAEGTTAKKGVGRGGRLAAAKQVPVSGKRKSGRPAPPASQPRQGSGCSWAAAATAAASVLDKLDLGDVVHEQIQHLANEQGKGGGGGATTCVEVGQGRRRGPQTRGVVQRRCPGKGSRAQGSGWAGSTRRLLRLQPASCRLSHQPSCR